VAGVREADYSPPFCVEVKECVEPYLHSPYVFTAWYLIKQRDNFYLLKVACEDRRMTFWKHEMK
jgi:hypothetical protein